MENNVKRTFLHLSYEDKGNEIHKYYCGPFDMINNQLAELVSDDLFKLEYIFQSKPFENIEPNRYIKLP